GLQGLVATLKHVEIDGTPNAGYVGFVGVLPDYPAGGGQSRAGYFVVGQPQRKIVEMPGQIAP
nr:hypothetical protein [Tanacetum cinerariifolium]